MNDNLPVYELVIEEDSSLDGVYAISLVDTPAIEENWYAMSKQKEYKMEVQDNVKQILLGPVMIPNKKVYRVNPEEKWVFFSEYTCRRAAELFMQGAYQSRTTHMHNLPLRGNTVIESWIIEDPENDKSKLYGYDLPKGTWMCSVKVNDKKYWEEFIQTGQLRGFSLEGYFTDVLINMEVEKNKNKNKNKMAKKQNYNFADLSPNFVLDSGMEVSITDEWTLINTSTGEALPGGCYDTEDGACICVSTNGFVTNIETPESEDLEDMLVIGDAPIMYAKQKASKTKNKKKKMGKQKNSKDYWKSFLKGLNVRFEDEMPKEGDEKSKEDMADITTEITFPEEGSTFQITVEDKVYDVVITPAETEPVSEPASTGEPVENPALEVSQLRKELAKMQAEVKKLNAAPAPIVGGTKTTEQWATVDTAKSKTSTVDLDAYKKAKELFRK